MLEGLIAVSSSFFTVLVMTFMYGQRLSKLEVKVEFLVKLHSHILEGKEIV